jgi:hypothetical protein
VVIDIVLPAVLGLVLVRKSSVETCGVNCKFIFNRIHFDYFDIPAGQKLAIRPFLSIFEERGGEAMDIPVTNLKGLVSRSSSDMIAIEMRITCVESGRVYVGGSIGRRSW